MRDNGEREVDLAFLPLILLLLIAVSTCSIDNNLDRIADVAERQASQK